MQNPVDDVTSDQTAPRFGYLIGRIDRLVRRALDEALSDVGITLSQYTLMAIAAARPGLSNAQLARRALVSPQAMNQAVAGLIELDMLARTAHPTNRRILCLTLTAAGYESLAELNTIVDSVEARLLHGLDDTTRASIIANLSTVAELEH